MARDVISALRSLKKYTSLMLGDDFEVRMTGEEGTFRRPYALVGMTGPTQYPKGASYVLDVAQPFSIHAYPTAGPDPDQALLNALAVEDRIYTGIRQGAGQLNRPTVPSLVAGVGTIPAGTYTYSVAAIDRRLRTTNASPTASITTTSVGGITVTWPAVRGVVQYAIYRNGYLLARTVGIEPTYVDTGFAIPSTRGVAPTVNGTIVGAPLRVPLWDYDGVSLQQMTSSRDAVDYMRVADFSVQRSVDTEEARLYSVTSDLRLTWRRPGEEDAKDGYIVSATDRALPY